jgi:SAM-dependent methyltransferase
MNKSFFEKLTFVARNLRSRDVFRALKQYCTGDVLDVGGRDFYEVAKKEKLAFTTWTNLEYFENHIINVDDKKVNTVLGDGCCMPFQNEKFNTILNIQVLEHVMEPLKMMAEMRRVLKTGGYGIFLIPQTSVLHEAPCHYYNFTRYWIEEAAKASKLTIVELRALGGTWSSMASHLVYFFLQVLGTKGLSTSDYKKNAAFYLLCPLMLVYALICIPLCMLLSLGDLTENPNNHLVIVKKLI